MTNDNRSNWPELKERVKHHIKDFSKSPAQVEKMVSRIRWNCQELISDEKLKEESMIPNSNPNVFKISFNEASKFCKYINILEFVRRTILTIDGESFQTFLKEL